MSTACVPTRSGVAVFIESSVTMTTTVIHFGDRSESVTLTPAELTAIGRIIATILREELTPFPPAEQIRYLSIPRTTP